MAKQLTICILAVILVGTSASPHIRVARQSESDDVTEQPSEIETKLGLPSNSTSIRANIVDTFSCEGRTYGYYADVDNECQIFHVCMPVVYSGGKEETFKWSFICPEETIFNQESFTCARPEDSVSCEEAPELYSLNANFGVTDKPVDRVIANDGIEGRSAAQKTSAVEPKKAEVEAEVAAAAPEQEES